MCMTERCVYSRCQACLKKVAEFMHLKHLKGEDNSCKTTRAPDRAIPKSPCCKKQCAKQTSIAEPHLCTPRGISMGNPEH